MARLADQIAGIFVPAVCVIAVLAAVIWALLGKDSGFVLNVFVSVLVVACPCALGFGHPHRGDDRLQRGRALGDFVPGRASNGGGAKVEYRLFDKTGTITTGKLTVPGRLSRPRADGGRGPFGRLLGRARLESPHRKGHLESCPDPGRLLYAL